VRKVRWGSAAVEVCDENRARRRRVMTSIREPPGLNRGRAALAPGVLCSVLDNLWVGERMVQPEHAAL
jgi:hypothetical protein